VDASGNATALTNARDRAAGKVTWLEAALLRADPLRPTYPARADSLLAIPRRTVSSRS
jgi:hypothetical protein